MFDIEDAPVVVTPTVAVPAVPRSAEVIAAVSCVLFTKVVVLLLPFHVTADPLIKLVPFTVNVKPGVPAFAFAGLRELVVGVLTGVTDAHVVPTLIPSIICADAEAAVPCLKAILSIVPASPAPPLVVAAIVAAGSGEPKTGFT